VETVASGAAGFAAVEEPAGNTTRVRGRGQGKGAIISLIMGIVSQTHLLGVNTVIEAARAAR